MFRRSLVRFFIVALLALAVAAAAAAEGGLFGALGAEFDDARLAALEDAAVTVSASQSADGVTVEVSQAYYEGDRVYVSFRVSGPAEVLDGLETADGSFADIAAGGEADTEDGSVLCWRECVVPEEALADTQTFCLAYRTPQGGEKALLPFTVERHGYDHTLEGASQDGPWQAEAVLNAGKIDMKGTVRLTSPEQAASWLAWQEGSEGTGADVIVCWNLYQNGEPAAADLTGEIGVEGTDEVVFRVSFPRVSDLGGLALVPEYSEAGEKPEEAVALVLTDPV